MPRPRPGTDSGGIASAKRFRLFTLAAALLIVVAIGVFAWLRHEVPPLPPLPEDFSTLDAATTRSIIQAADAVLDDISSASAWRELGMVYQSNFFYDKASVCYERAIALDSDDARSRYLLALNYATLGETAKAIDAGRAAAELSPHDPSPHWRTGLWLLEDGQLDLAERYIRQAMAIDADDVNAHICLARLHLQRNHVHEAIELLEPLRDRGLPAGAYVEQLLGTAYRRAGRADDAEVALERSRHGRPVWIDPWEQDLYQRRVVVGAQLQRARMASMQGRLDLAVSILSQLKAHYPLDPLVPINLAMCFREHGDFAQAFRALEEAIDLQPDSYFAYTQRAFTLLVQSESTSASRAPELLLRALDDIDRALDVNPAYAEAHGVRGHIRAAQDRYDDALRSYLAAAQYEPERTLWQERAGDASRKLGRWEQAHNLYTSVIQQDPQHAAVWFKLSEAAAQIGRIDESRHAQQQAQRLAPGRDSSAPSRLPAAPTNASNQHGPEPVEEMQP